MENLEKKEIAIALRKYLDERSITINAFAKQNKDNISSAYVSMMLTGLDNPDKWEKISDLRWVFIKNKIGLATKWRFAKSKNYSAITELCRVTQQNSGFKAVCGFTGAGKTESLLRYQRENANVFYVEYSILDTAKRDFIDPICKAMGLTVEGSLRNKLNAIIHKLNNIETPLLILDQFDKLSHGNKLIVQAINDGTKHKAGIIVAGTNAMKTELKKFADKDKIGFRELYRRIEYWLPLRRPSKRIVETICTSNGLGDKRCIEYISNNAKNYGEIRNYIQELLGAAMRLNVPADLKLLEEIKLGDAEFERGETV